MASFTLLNTRPAHQSDHLRTLVASQGGASIACPSMQIVPLAQPTLESENAATDSEPKSLEQVLDSLLQMDVWLFVSVNAVNIFIDRLRTLMPDFATRLVQTEVPKIYAIGEATDAALQATGLVTQARLHRQFDSESLLASPAFQSLYDAKVLIVKGLGGRDKLSAELKARGANVWALSVYERQPAVWCADVWQEFKALPEPIVLFSSVYSFEAFKIMMQQAESLAEFNELLKHEAVVFSHRIQNFLRDAGWSGPIEVVPIQSDLGILQAIDQLRERRFD